MPLIQRLLGIVVAIPLVLAAFFFASIVLAAAAILALLVGGWMWWKTRDVRRAMEERVRERSTERPGAVIEGEYRVEQPRDHAKKKIP